MGKDFFFSFKSCRAINARRDTVEAAMQLWWASPIRQRGTDLIGQ